LGEHNRPYLADVRKRFDDDSLGQHFEHVASPDHAGKVRFLQSIDVLSVPTVYREPKGLYVLEAMANGVPVVQPRHGSFPELIEATDGGVLHEPEDAADLAVQLSELARSPERRELLARKGLDAVVARFGAARMANQTTEIYSRYIRS